MSSSVRISAIYTDGACSGNPGPGGWGARIEFSDGQAQELGAAEANTTNNRMEMQAAIAALEYWQTWRSQVGQAQASQGDRIPLYTDSQYVIKGITQWIRGWKRKGWKNAQGNPVLNQDLWEQMDDLNSPHIDWQYVRGHAGNPGNERCDAIARSFSLGRTPTLNRYESVAKPSGSDKKIALTEEKAGFSSLKSLESENPCAIDEAESDMSIDAVHETASDHAGLSRDARVAQIRNLVDTLHMADDIADKGYLISSSELADLMDINASAVTSRGEQWVWRNWVVSRVRREGNQILWQLERVD